MKYIVAIITLIYVQASVASTVNSTQITSILVGKVYGNVAFIGVSTKPILSDLPECQTNPNYNYAFDPTTEIGKVTLSIALTAYASQKPVFINGYSNCNLYPSVGVEELRQLMAK